MKAQRVTFRDLPKDARKVLAGQEGKEFYRYTNPTDADGYDQRKHLVKVGRKVKGFVFQKSDRSWWYAFGKPSQDQYISFACRSLEHGRACIEVPTLNQSMQ